MGNSFFIVKNGALVPVGSAGSPTLSVQGDEDTGIYFPSANTIGIATGGALRFDVSSAGLASASATGALLTTAAASGTAPTLVPNRASANTGIGAQASGNMSLVASGTEVARVTSTGIEVLGSASLLLAADPVDDLGAATKRYVDDSVASGLSASAAGAGLVFNAGALDVATASSARIVISANSIDLATTAVAAGTYQSLTVDAYGRATAGSGIHDLTSATIVGADELMFADSVNSWVPKRTTATGLISSLSLVQSSRTISTATGLSGGGDLTANRTLSLDITSLSTTAAVSGDELLFYDVSAPGHAKRTMSSLITDLGIWTASNDGAASGLDADLLDGQHGAYYAVAATSVSTSRSISTGSGLSGGGDLSADRTLSLNITGLANTAVVSGDELVVADASASFAPIKRTLGSVVSDLGIVLSTRSISAGSGLSGGGDLSADRTLSLNITGLANTAVVGSDELVVADASASFAPIKRTLTNVISDLGLATTSGTLSSSTSSTQSGYFGDIFLYDDSTPSHYLQITNGANLTLARTLTIDTGDASRTLTFTGNATISGTTSGTNTGDQTITLTGNVTGSGTGSFATTIANNVVTNAMLAQVATATFKGRTTASTGNVEDLTTAQATALLDVFTTSLKGLAPSSGGGTSNFLRADGTWAVPPGTGLADGDKGDITVSASGATWTIDNSAVTLAKMANLAQNTVIGRVTASTGVPEALTSDNLITVLNAGTTTINLARVNSTTLALLAGNTFTGSNLDTNASGYQLTTGAASATAPTLVPNRASSTTGIGAQASGNLSLIASGTEATRVTSTSVIIPLTGISLRLDTAAGNERRLGIYTGSSARWVLGGNATAEGGSNAGTDFAIDRYDDAGAFIDTSLLMTRSTGTVSGANSSGWQLVAGAASSTVPTLVPNKASTTTGIGAQASGNLSLVASGTEAVRVTSSAMTVRVSGVSLGIDAAAATERRLGIYSGGSLRWIFGGNATAEGGSDAGTDFFVGRYNDAASFVDSPLQIIRSTGTAQGANTSGWQLVAGAASGTVPTIVPSRSSATTGIGSAGSNIISFINSGTEIARTSTSALTIIAENDISLRLNRATVTSRFVGFYTNGSLRWGEGVNATAEGGSDAGSDWAINRYSDAGAYLSTPFFITRSTGHITNDTASSWTLRNVAASSTVPTLVPNKASTTTGIGAQASGNISLIAGGTEAVRVTSTALTGFVSQSDTNASGYQLTTGAASGTAPTLVPNRASTTTGIGAQASGNLSLVASGTEAVRVTSTDVSVRGSVTMTLAVDPSSALHAVTKQYVDNAKHLIWVPAVAMYGRTTNGAASGTAETATNRVMIRTLDYDATTQEFAQFQVQMPKRWNESTVTAIFVWSHASTATNFGVVWGLQGVAFSDDDAMDAAFGTGVTVADTGGTTNDLYRTAETSAITIGGTPAENDVVTFQVYRDPANGSDTMAIDARLHGVALFITSNAVTDA